MDVEEVAADDMAAARRDADIAAVGRKNAREASENMMTSRAEQFAEMAGRRLGQRQSTRMIDDRCHELERPFAVHGDPSMPVVTSGD